MCCFQEREKLQAMMSHLHLNKKQEEEKERKMSEQVSRRAGEQKDRKVGEQRRRSDNIRRACRTEQKGSRTHFKTFLPSHTRTATHGPPSLS